MPTPPPPAVPISTTSAWSARVAKKYYYVPGLRSQLALRKKLIKYEKLKKSKTPSMSTHRKSTTFRETHRKSTTYDEYSSKVPPSRLHQSLSFPIFHNDAIGDITPESLRDLPLSGMRVTARRKRPSSSCCGLRTMFRYEHHEETHTPDPFAFRFMHQGWAPSRGRTSSTCFIQLHKVQGKYFCRCS